MIKKLRKSFKIGLWCLSFKTPPFSQIDKEKNCWLKREVNEEL